MYLVLFLCYYSLIVANLKMSMALCMFQFYISMRYVSSVAVDGKGIVSDF